jgi:hypothetical protein
VLAQSTETRPSPRWPFRGALWARLAVPLVLFAFTSWVHLASFGSLLQYDSHIFVVVARQLRHGLLPYRDLWELKPPGVFYYLAGIFAVLPDALWSVRLVDFALYACAGFAFYRLCRFEASRLFALMGSAAWLYFGHHYLFNLGGLYTEEYAAIGGIFAVASAAAYGASGDLRWAFASGLAVAAAALFKHPGASALAPAFILMSRRPAALAYALLLLGATLPLVLVIGYFWSRGALEDFLECNLWALITHGRLAAVDQALLSQRLRDLVIRGREMLAPFPILTGSLVVGLPVAVLRPTWLRAAALSWVVLDALGVAAQRQYAQHHFILTFPSICLLGTLAAAWLLQPRPGERRLVTLPRIAVCSLALWFALPELHTAWKARQPVVNEQWRLFLSGPSAWRWSPARELESRVGEYVRERTGPEDRIHVQGFGGTLLGVYWAADRPVATRYFYEAPFPIDQARALAELQRSRPAYVVVGSHPPFLFLMPWLTAEYSIETVKWHDYRIDIWARTERGEFSAGSAAGLAPTPEAGGLGLASLPGPSTGGGARERLAEPRRGVWTSPVLPVRSDDGKVFVDWNPRADLAWNRVGRGFAEVEATFAGADNDVRAVLGVPTRRGFWTAWPRRDPQAVTVQLGFEAMLDQVILVPGKDGAGAEGCTPALVQRRTRAGGGAEAPDFQPAGGSWERFADGEQAFRIQPPLPANAVRVTVTASSCGTEGGLHRIRVRPEGMGITVRYRSGAEPRLDRKPWQPIDDDDELKWIAADRYVQVQYELWSVHADLTPILRAAQVGHIRFEPDRSNPGGRFSATGDGG